MGRWYLFPNSLEPDGRDYALSKSVDIYYVNENKCGYTKKNLFMVTVYTQIRALNISFLEADIYFEME